MNKSKMKSINELRNLFLGKPQERITEIKDVSRDIKFCLRKLKLAKGKSLEGIIDNIKITNNIYKENKKCCDEVFKLAYELMVPKRLKNTVSEKEFVEMLYTSGSCSRRDTYDRKKDLFRYLGGFYDTSKDIIYLRPLKKYKFIEFVFHEIGHKIIRDEANKKPRLKCLIPYKIGLGMPAEEALCWDLSEAAVEIKFWGYRAVRDRDEVTRRLMEEWKAYAKETVFNPEYVKKTERKFKRDLAKLLKKN